MYFNHAFKKVFVGTKDSATETYTSGRINGVNVQEGDVLVQAGIDYGFITSKYKTVTSLDGADIDGGAIIKTSDLQFYGMGAGTFAFFDTNYEIKQNADFDGDACCPLYLVAASWRQNDKLGDFHGGYLESKKSPLIHAKNVSKVYKVDSCVGRQQVLSVGYTPYTSQDIGAVATGAKSANGIGYAAGTYATTGGTGTGATITVTVTGAATEGVVDAVTNGATDSSRTAATYSGVATTTTGSGTGATLDVVVAGGGVPTTTVDAGGEDYAVGDFLIVADSDLGSGGAADLIVQITAITLEDGAVNVMALADGGVGYTAGDVLTLVGGLNDATYTVATITASIDEDSLCEKQFLCGEVYNFGIEIKRSPALRTLNHNIYQNIGVSTGCCDGDTPTAVDPALVYIDLASQIIENNYLKDFITPVVFDTEGNAWYAPGTTVTLDGTNTAVTEAMWWTNYELDAAWTTSMEAGIRLYGAYVDTKFGNCSFKVSDFFEKEPIRFELYLTNMDGSPCEFEQICSYTECEGLTGTGFGETVLRSVLLDELYAQNPFHCDTRLREVTESDTVFDIIDRNEMYTLYYIVFNIDRKQNPTSVHNNDQYLLEIVTKGTSASLETFLTNWLVTNGCSTCLSLDDSTVVCADCELIPDDATDTRQ